MQPKSPKPYDTFTFYDASPDSNGTSHGTSHGSSKLSSTHTTPEMKFFERGWKTPFLLLWLIASLPFVSYTMWRALSDMQKKDWISLAARTRRLHKVGFKTHTTRYWLAISYSNLNQWGDAVEVFEKMSRPLETVADDAARYCAHVWALQKLGRVEEASELLLHALQEDWPEDRRNWAGRFLEQYADEGTAEFMFEVQPTLLH